MTLGQAGDIYWGVGVQGGTLAAAKSITDPRPADGAEGAVPARGVPRAGSGRAGDSHHLTAPWSCPAPRCRSPGRCPTRPPGWRGQRAPGCRGERCEPGTAPRAAHPGPRTTAVTAAFGRAKGALGPTRHRRAVDGTTESWVAPLSCGWRDGPRTALPHHMWHLQAMHDMMEHVRHRHTTHGTTKPCMARWTTCSTPHPMRHHRAMDGMMDHRWHRHTTHGTSKPRMARWTMHGVTKPCVARWTMRSTVTPHMAPPSHGWHDGPHAASPSHAWPRQPAAVPRGTEAGAGGRRGPWYLSAPGVSWSRPCFLRGRGALSGARGRPRPHPAAPCARPRAQPDPHAEAGAGCDPSAPVTCPS